MKTLALLSLALIVAGAAHAKGGNDDYDFQNRNAPASTLTRAEVQAERARAAAAGEIQNGEHAGTFIINQQAGSPRDVGAVREEAREAARKHPRDLA